MTTEKQDHGAVAYLLLLFMGLAWGLGLSFSKIASTSGGHPIGLALWQVIVSSSMLLMFSLFRFRPSMPRPSVIGFSLFCGLFGVGFPAIALFWSTKYLPAGVVAIAFASMPMFTYLLSMVFRVEHADRIRWLGVIIGFIAMALLIVPEGALPDPDLVPWVLLALAASVGMSLENCYAGGMRPPGISSVQLSCGRQFGAVFYLLPIALITGTLMPIFEPWGAVQWAATGTGVLSGLAFTALLYVIRTSGAVFASQSAYLVTLAGMMWGMILFGERHSAYIWGALVLTIIGCALVRPRTPVKIGIIPPIPVE
ncbi:MAG: DMT family transporter [Rhodospirillales bacterium]|nr:DMT family transporter [Rhodospirillales bacterium]